MATALTAEAARLHEDYDVGAVPAALLEGWLAEQRGDPLVATAAFRRALERSERAGFIEHASFALTGLGSIAFGSGDSARPKRGIAGRWGSPRWLRRLGRWRPRRRISQVLESPGDAEDAATLSGVLAGASSRDPTRARALFFALAGHPATAAAEA